MSKAFDTARKQTKKSNKKWYTVKMGNYEVYIWALPIAPFAIAIEKFKDWQYKRMVWSDERATKVLDKTLPKVLEWVAEENAFYYCMQWGNSSLWRKAPRADRKWARKYAYDLQKFIQEKYENIDYIKTVEDPEYYYYDTWVKFVEK